MRKLLVVAVLAATTSACSVQTIGAPQGGFEFEAEFTDVQSLVVGHSVQVSDVAVGTVTGIELQESFRAHVVMELEPGLRLPQGVTASVAKTSLLGENYIRITLPDGSTMNSEPSLPEGALITQTHVQPDLESISEKVGPVLAAVGGQDIEQIITALATALRDKGPELNKLIKQISEVSDSYAAAGKDLENIIDGLDRLGDSLAKKSGEFDRLPGRLTLATERIHRDRKELKAAVQELVNLGGEFNERIHSEHGARLQNLLSKLDRMLKAMVRGRKDLKALVEGLNYGLLGAPSLTYKGQGLMQAWLVGFMGFDSDASHVTANNGRGENVDLSISARKALSPVGQKKKED
ncbi:MlaD family protein [Actinocorallia aurantiaca]|jgi:phospholipid/cholesterol/gamma-HCH transport system substrate-binding protein|uniref:Phospholipid/cholesterol/gamma-HCH transport system substrate-binding protein n=1 Tax=Actinocorallia aurantiaca TaxID=46204 RepID=A0ABN3UJ67_9ACTN